MTLLDERILSLHNLLDMADLAASSSPRHTHQHFCWSGSLFYDLVVRDTHLVKLVDGRALLTDGIVHSTLLVDDVVLGALVKLIVILSSIVCAHRSCWSSLAFWALSAFWAHNPVKQLLHFMCR